MKGKTGKKINEYNAQGSPEEKEADKTEDGFKKGGKVKKYRHGGHVKGHSPKNRLDRKPRASGGRTPYTSAKSVSGGAAEDDGHGEVCGPGAETKIGVYKHGGRTKHKK